MLVWGGETEELGPGLTLGYLDRYEKVLGDGARYNPTTDMWRPISAIGAPAPRFQHLAVWTGTEMVIWGGIPSSTVDVPVMDAARYNPTTDTWTPMSLEGAPVPLVRPDAVWTGSEFIVWGAPYARPGTRRGPLTYVGTRYNLATDRWQPLPSAPPGTFWSMLVWTGSELIAWGSPKVDASVDQLPGAGARWSPATNQWTPVSTVGAPIARIGQAVWTGERMLVWDGQAPRLPQQDGGSYDPVTDRWEVLPAVGAPANRAEGVVIWTGRELLWWSGWRPLPGSDFEQLADGGAYDPQRGTWRALPPAPLEARRGHRAVWTGSEMIVWGGWARRNNDPFLSDGARYLPPC
jgi:hypothetical protein